MFLDLLNLEMRLKLLDGENQERFAALNLVRCVRVLCAVLVLLLSLSLTKKANAQSYSFKTAVYSKSSIEKMEEVDVLLAEEAVHVCKCAIRNPETIKRSLLNAKRLLVVERKLGVPDLMIGMSLAAACSESCYNDQAKGDHSFSKNGKRPKAVGILQLWPWVKKHGVDRKDLESSATFWISHISKVRQKTMKLCKPRTELLSWRQAWVAGVRAPKKGGRCREVPKHWRHFKKIQKIKKEINHNHECCGC